MCRRSRFEPMTNWQNRIIEHGVKPAVSFTANPDNPRVHPQAQRESMRGSLDTLGWIAPVIELKNGYLLDGHERIWQALDLGDDTPVPYIVVDLTEDEIPVALASFDFITTMATYDRDRLDALLHEVKTDNPALQAMLSEMAERNGLYQDKSSETYSRKVEAPIYTPSDQKPAISELYQDTKTGQLIQEIEIAPDLTDDEKRFLKIAAQRHTVLNFSKIADYYAHSSAAVQRLMENSALVIIDFNRAIELGFVKLTEHLADLYDQDYPDD